MLFVCCFCRFEFAFLRTPKTKLLGACTHEAVPCVARLAKARVSKTETQTATALWRLYILDEHLKVAFALATK